MSEASPPVKQKTIAIWDTELHAKLLKLKKELKVSTVEAVIKELVERNEGKPYTKDGETTAKIGTE